MECTCKASEMPFGRCCKADTDDRREFESWIGESGWNLARNADNGYVAMTTEAAYAGWIAGRETERRACHDLSLINGTGAPIEGEWTMAQSIARAIRYRGKMA